MKENIKLFAVYLGGRADGCNTELHDVVFTCGQKIQDTYIWNTSCHIENY